VRQLVGAPGGHETTCKGPPRVGEEVIAAPRERRQLRRRMFIATYRPTSDRVRVIRGVRACHPHQRAYTEVLICMQSEKRVSWRCILGGGKDRRAIDLRASTGARLRVACAPGKGGWQANVTLPAWNKELGLEACDDWLFRGIGWFGSNVSTCWACRATFRRRSGTTQRHDLSAHP
jgi:hypothetical protein